MIKRYFEISDFEMSRVDCICRNFENIGIKMLEKISSQHKDDVRNVLDGKSKLWGDLCPAELAFFANFKVRKESNYSV